MSECVFCKIVSGEMPADIVFENDQLVVFKDIKPSAPVHLLVVPREHVVSIKELAGGQEEIVSSLVYTAKDVAAKEKLEGYKLVFNVGRQGGQLIDHLHLHLLGGWPSDGKPGKVSV